LRLFILFLFSVVITYGYTEGLKKFIILPEDISLRLCFSKIPKRYKREIPSNPWFWSRRDINLYAKDIYDKANPNAIMEVVSYIYAPKEKPTMDLAVVFVMRMNKVLYKDELHKVRLFYARHKGEVMYLTKFPIIVVVISKYRMQRLLEKIILKFRERLKVL